MAVLTVFSRRWGVSDRVEAGIATVREGTLLGGKSKALILPL